MKIYGWIFMIVFWSLIIIFTVYTFAKILQSSNKKSHKNNDSNFIDNSSKNS